VQLDPSAAFECKLCRGREVATSYRLQRHTKNTEPFAAAICARCGLFQDVYDWRAATRRQPSSAAHAAGRLDRLWDSEPEHAANRAKGRVFARALDEAGLVQGKRILDVGCGNGDFLRECRSLGAASVTGQEFLHGDAISYARNELAIDDIRTVPFEDRDAWPDAEFDVVCSFDVVEHVHDLAGFFEECIRVAKRTGALFHATPGYESLANRVGRIAVSRLGRAHRIRTFGTSLCNLQPADNLGGGAHVSLMGRRPLQWLASQYPLTLAKAYYTPSYTYSNQHYAALVPGLNRLPLPLGSAMFGIARRVVRNKLVFLARKSSNLSEASAAAAVGSANARRSVARLELTVGHR
jgi:2-polyprenyl-3-methyl-5-hydroxy-6-metoxy-1,4-benzoquinol methylase